LSPWTFRRSDQNFRIFDAGEESIVPYLDLSTAARPGLKQRRVNLDLPSHVLQKLDFQATLRGMTRQSLIKAWLYDKLQEELDRALPATADKQK